MPNHSTLLSLHCRICGLRRSQESRFRPKDTFKTNPDISQFLRHLHDVEVKYESSEIFPPKVCELCVKKLRAVTVVYTDGRRALDNVFELAVTLHTNGCDDDLRRLARRFPISDFWAHSSTVGQCGICDADTAKDDDLTTSQLAAGTKVVVELNLNEDVRLVKFVDVKLAAIVKRPIAGAAYSNSIEKGAPDSKKPKVADVVLPTSSSSSATTAQVNHWPKFNELLGMNRKHRADKIADILTKYVEEVPKVVTDLKGSGIAYKASHKRHFVGTYEYKTSLTRCLALLHVLPTPKKSLMLFRAITDTASDGQFNILNLVGIHVDLTNSNVAFLLRRIRNKASATINARAGTTTKGPPTTRILNKLPSSITVSKVEARQKPKPKSKKALPPEKKGPLAPIMRSRDNSKVQYAELDDDEDLDEVPTVIVHAPAAKSLPLEVEIKEEEEEEEEAPAAEEEEEPSSQVGGSSFNEARVRVLINRLNKNVCVNRQLRADIIRDVIMSRQRNIRLLNKHGIIFDAKISKLHLGNLATQRKAEKKKVEKMLELCNDEEWAAIIAEIIFGLLHPEDTLTLRIVGIMVDPFHERSPLPFRLNFMLKQALMGNEDPQLAKTLLAHILEAVDIKPSLAGQQVENAIVTLLYCDPNDAKRLVALVAGKKIKIPILKKSLKGQPQEVVQRQQQLQQLQVKLEPLPLPLPAGKNKKGAGRPRKPDPVVSKVPAKKNKKVQNNRPRGLPERQAAPAPKRRAPNNYPRRPRGPYKKKGKEPAKGSGGKKKKNYAKPWESGETSEEDGQEDPPAPEHEEIYYPFEAMPEGEGGHAAPQDPLDPLAMPAEPSAEVFIKTEMLEPEDIPASQVNPPEETTLSTIIEAHDNEVAMEEEDNVVSNIQIANVSSAISSHPNEITATHNPAVNHSNVISSEDPFSAGIQQQNPFPPPDSNDVFAAKPVSANNEDPLTQGSSQGDPFSSSGRQTNDDLFDRLGQEQNSSLQETTSNAPEIQNTIGNNVPESLGNENSGNIVQELTTNAEPKESSSVTTNKDDLFAENDQNVTSLPVIQATLGNAFAAEPQPEESSATDTLGNADAENTLGNAEPQPEETSTNNDLFTGDDQNVASLPVIQATLGNAEHVSHDPFSDGSVNGANVMEDSSKINHPFSGGQTADQRPTNNDVAEGGQRSTNNEPMDTTEPLSDREVNDALNDDPFSGQNDKSNDDPFSGGGDKTSGNDASQAAAEPVENQIEALLETNVQQQQNNGNNFENLLHDDASGGNENFSNILSESSASQDDDAKLLDAAANELLQELEQPQQQQTSGELKNAIHDDLDLLDLVANPLENNSSSAADFDIDTLLTDNGQGDSNSANNMQ